MSTMTQRKKLSKGTWALIIVVGVAVLTAVILHVVGILNLSFIGDLAIGFVSFGTSSGWNAALVLLAPFAVGILTLYTLKAYFIGERVTINTGTPGYAPAPTYPTQTPHQGKETTIT